MITRRTFLASAAAIAGAGLAARPARSLGLRTLALVTADLESAIVVVDPVSGRALGRISCAADPRSIERVGRSGALVAHTAQGTLSLVDARARRVVRVLRGLGEPRYAAVSPDARYAYVTDSAGGQIVTVDLERARAVRRTDVGGPARHLGLTPDGRTLWTALGNTAAQVAVLDVTSASRPRLARRVVPPFLAHDVAAAPDGSRLWVSSGDRGAIAVYDRTAREPRFQLAADEAPQHIAFAGEVAYVASGDSGTLRAHRLSDGRRMWTTRLPFGSYNIATTERFLVSPSLSAGTLARLRPPGRDARAGAVARSAHDACLVLA